MADATNYLDDLPEEGFRPTVGTYVSVGGHAALVVWLVAGWGLTQEPLPFETVDVSVVSSEEYAAIVRRGEPQVDPEESVSLTAPTTETAPEVTPEEPIVPVTPEVRPEVPEEEITPVPLEPVTPPAEVADEAPVLEAPAPPTAPDLPVTEDTPQVEQAPRIAPEAAPEPELNVDVAPVVQQEVTESPEPAEVLEDPAEATAPEQATTETVTEADEPPSGAVETSLRPPSRPASLNVPEPEPEVVEEPEEEPTPPAEDTTIDDLLTGLQEEPAEDPVVPDTGGDPGPQMTGAQRESFGRSIVGCWIIDPGSEAAGVTVTVAFSLDRDRRVVGNQVTLLSNTGGSDAAVRTAFEKARRAILNCQRRGDGFPLDDAQYEQWRDVEMNFNPEQMRIR